MAIRSPASGSMSSSPASRRARSTRKIRRTALITDIQLAPKNSRGNVVYQHNFYILQPLDPSKGNHKMMYEPPNRGGKTYQTLNNTPTGTNDPAALTDAAALDDSFLWTRGYTTVWSGWENNLGTAERSRGDGLLADRRQIPTIPSPDRDTSTS